MKRIVALALLLIALVAGVAHGQSDSRKLAVMVPVGGAGNGLMSGIGVGDGSVCNIYTASLYDDLFRILQHAAIPYDVIGFTDSTRYGSPGVDDSTWFRQQGYMALMWIQCSVGSSSGTTREGYYYFTAGSTKGTLAVSPMGGGWSIPAYVVVPTVIETNAGFSFSCGVKMSSVLTAETNNRQLFTNGDTLEWGPSSNRVIVQPDEAANVTVITRVDSINGTATGVWKYGTGAGCYYWRGDAAQPTSLLLALGHMLDNVQYTPARKIPAMIVIDRPFPKSLNVAKLDTMLAHGVANGWRMLGADNADEASTSFRFVGGDSVAQPENKAWINQQQGAVRSIYNNPGVLFFTPQSHTSGIGNYTYADSWNQTTFADTSLLWQRWNLLERRITNNYKLPRAEGAYKHAVMPDAGISQFQAYGLPQSGYLTVRSYLLTDSSRSKRLYLESTQYGVYPFLPPGGTRPIWVTWFTGTTGGIADSAFANMDYAWSSNTYTGRMGALIQDLAGAIANGGSTYLHGGPTMQGADMTGANYFRRWAYYLNRLSRFVTVEPVINTRRPRPLQATSRS